MKHVWLVYTDEAYEDACDHLSAHVDDRQAVVEAVRAAARRFAESHTPHLRGMGQTRSFGTSQLTQRTSFP